MNASAFSPARVCGQRCRSFTAALIAGIIKVLVFSGYAAPGDLDPTFGGTGIVTTAIGSGFDERQGVIVQSDGKIVVAGNAFRSSYDFALLRYNPNGTLDTSFNGTGTVVTPIGSGADYALSVAQQDDGKLVVTGRADNGSRFDMAVVRYNPDGSLDTSFNGTGKVVTAIGAGRSWGRAVAIQPDGKIVVAGWADPSVFALVRFNSNGSRDGNFGNAGIVTTTVGSGGGMANSVALQEDGKIVAAGYSSDGNGRRYFAVVRYLPDGTLDTSFNGTGRATPAFGSISHIAQSVAVQRDGKIVTAGYADISSTSYFALARYNGDGSLDSSFNSTGKVLTAIGDSAAAQGVTIQRNGKLVAAGRTSAAGNYKLAVARYNPDGSLDQTFNGSGIATSDAGTSREWIDGVGLQRDGKIVVAGRTDWSDPYAVVVARYEGDGLAGPQIQIEQPPRVSVVSGGTRYVGGAVPGASATLTFTVTNQGTARLTISALTIDGTDAAAFQVSASPAAFIEPDKSTGFSVRFAPTTTGPRTAALHIVSNDVAHSPFDIVLTGMAFPAPAADIAVEEPPGTDRPDGGISDFGFVHIGNSRGLVFTFKNKGDSDLTGLTMTKDGPDAGMFSVTAIPIAPVSPGGSGNFTVEFTPTGGGIKTAVLHFASNDPDENPFDLTLTGTGKFDPGDVDPTFNTVTTNNGGIEYVAVQPDRKIIIGGSFVTVNGVAHNHIARLEENGALDSSFNFSAASAVTALTVQMDGKILIGTKSGLARINADGSPDLGFQSSLSKELLGLGLQPDGKIVVITALNAGSGPGIRRVSSGGTLEAGFNPTLDGYQYPRWLAVKGDGSFVVAQGSATVGQGGSNALHIGTFSRAGALIQDNRYSSGSSSPSSFSVSTLVLVEGGDYAFGGDVGYPQHYYGPGNTSGQVYAILGQTDRKLLIDGDFGSVGGIPHTHPARLNSNGSLDATYVGSSMGLAIQADGKILTGTRRLMNDPATSQLTVPDARRVQWMRGGSSPVAIGVEFDYSPDGGGNWTALGTGNSIAGGWELTGLNLPGNARVRARARTASGNSYGVVETVTDYTVTPIPHIVVAQNPGGDLTSGSATPVDFGRIAIGGSASRTFTIRNIGWGDLTGLAVTKSGDGQPGDFTITPPVQTTLALNEEATFTVTLTPSASGVRTGAVLIASNDPDGNPFRISLTGTRNTVSENWREQHFGTFANTGPGADLSDPDGDGLVNLLEFATGGHPHEITPPVGTLEKVGAGLEFTYSRPVAVLTELNYRLEASVTLSGIWNSQNITSAVQSADGVTQVVKATSPAGIGRRFVRLRVTRL